MKSAILFSLFIAVALLCLSGVFGLAAYREIEASKAATYPLTKKDIMIVWQNGYVHGAHNILQEVNSSLTTGHRLTEGSQYLRDSIEMANRWESNVTN